MNTWVLVVILVSTNAVEPQGMTNIPGYRSKTECAAAGRALEQSQILGKETILRVLVSCIPGPDR